MTELEEEEVRKMLTEPALSSEQVLRMFKRYYTGIHKTNFRQYREEKQNDTDQTFKN